MEFTSGAILEDTEELYNYSRNEVLKYGSSSGITRGSLRLQGTAIRRQDIACYLNFGYELHDQIEVVDIGRKPFAEAGDSGALVFLTMEGKASDLVAIGIVEGGTKAGTTVITPICEVLESLGLKNKLLSFQNTPLKGASRKGARVSMDGIESPSLVQQATSSDSGFEEDIMARSPLNERVLALEEGLQQLQLLNDKGQTNLIKFQEEHKNEIKKMIDDQRDFVQQKFLELAQIFRNEK